jgi:hypothetical protein
MTGSSRNRNALLVIGTAVACAAVALTVGIASPRSISNPTLGAEWECHRSAGIVTTCRRLGHTGRMRSPTIDTRQV